MLLKLTKLKTLVGGCAPWGFLTDRQYDLILLNQSLMRSRHLQRFIYRYCFSPVTAAVKYPCTACQYTCGCQAHLVITMCYFYSEFCRKSASVTLERRQWSKLSSSICLSLWIKRIRAVLDISFHLCKYMQISRCYERIGHDPEQLVFWKDNCNNLVLI